MSEKNSKPREPVTDPWRYGSAACLGTVISLQAGAVQFIGRKPLAIDETVVSVPFSALFQIVGAVLSTLDPNHPENQAARAALFPSPVLLESANGAPEQ